MKTLRDIGEKGLLKKLLKRPRPFPRNPLGIGDDAAVLQPSPGKDLLVSTDTLVEGIDFDLSFHRPYRYIGHKALAVNLSDIAAMGGRPLAFVLSLSASNKTPVKLITEIFSGILTLARREGVSLIGGDLSASPRGLSLTITILGEVKKGHWVSRGGGRPGDPLFVSGPLGNSRAGLEILKRRKRTRGGLSTWNALIRAHLLPSAQTRLGAWLAKGHWATAMIDLSDGLAADIRNLCTSSRVGARIEEGLIPVSRPLRLYCRKRETEPERFALQGGEDFHLLFSVAAKRRPAFIRASKKAGFRVFPVGELTSGNRGVIYVDKKGKARPLTVRGYEHFR